MARRAGLLERNVATGIPGKVLFGPGLIGESMGGDVESSDRVNANHPNTRRGREQDNWLAIARLLTTPSA